MYMNGIGVMQRTEQLLCKLKEEHRRAIIGYVLLSATPILSIFLPTSWPWIFILGVATGAGFGLAYGWTKTAFQLIRHSKAIELENKRRGSGWARS